MRNLKDRTREGVLSPETANCANFANPLEFPQVGSPVRPRIAVADRSASANRPGAKCEPQQARARHGSHFQTAGSQFPTLKSRVHTPCDLPKFAEFAQFAVLETHHPSETTTKRKSVMSTTTAVVYRRHNCTRRHRTYSAFARCNWPRAAWITGEGPFAVVAYCRVTTITLHTTMDGACSALDLIDAGGCGGRCTRHHKLIRLETTP